MNPEFRRNVWLELTPRRLALMTIVLALAFAAAAVSGGKEFSPDSVAASFYYFIVVVWGARNASLAVVGEIRDRTWDGQRLSSLGAGTMTWGKLFGSTIYNWFGGAICLAVIAASDVVHIGIGQTAFHLVYFIAIGVIAQSVALLASLVAVRRRQNYSRFATFIYQIVGIVAAVAVLYVWEAADPAGSFITHKPATDFIIWWGAKFDARPFFLVSLAIFTGWTLVGCYREMRVELKMKNGPLIWVVFLLFIGIYVAGFDAWLSASGKIAGWYPVALRLTLAATTYAVLTYLMVLLEPKDRVLYRWLGGQFARARLDRFVHSLQCWMMSYVALVIVVVSLMVWLVRSEQLADAALIAAGLGFVTRDVAIFVLFQTLPGRRGDFAAVAVLFSLYALVPAILNGLNFHAALPFFYPEPSDPYWLVTVAAWAEAVVVCGITFGRLALAKKPEESVA